MKQDVRMGQGSAQNALRRNTQVVSCRTFFIPPPPADAVRTVHYSQAGTASASGGRDDCDVINQAHCFPEALTHENFVFWVCLFFTPESQIRVLDLLRLPGGTNHGEYTPLLMMMMMIISC